MVVERFLIKDIYGEIRSTINRKGFLMDDTGNNPVTFGSEQEAEDFLTNLSNGIYQIEKVFVVVNGDSNKKILENV